MPQLTINGQNFDVDAPGDMPLLWVIRDLAGMTGTRFGCGMGLCGACTVHVDGMAMRSCVTPVSLAAGKVVTTIEGLGADGLHPLQEAWIKHGVPQCGFCQAGQLMTAAAFLKQNPRPTDDDIDAAMAGNICRCGTYLRIRAGIRDAAAQLAPPEPPPAEVVEEEAGSAEPVEGGAQ